MIATIDDNTRHTDAAAPREEEAAWQASAAHQRAALDALHEGVVLQDADGHIVAANPAAERLLGMTADQLHGRTSRDPRWQAVREDGTALPGAAHPAAVALRTGRPQENVVLGVQRPGAGLVWLMVTAQPLRHPAASRPHGVVISFADITDRKRLEEALRADEARYRALVDHSADAVLLTAPGGQILAANPAACRLFGRTEDELCRLGRAGLVDPADPGLPALVAGHAHAGHFHGELAHLRRDGSRFPAEITSAVFRDRDGQLRASTTIRDITDRKRAEAALRESEARYRTLHAAATRQAQGLLLLDRVRTALARELELATVCRVVVEAIVQTFGYTQVSLYLREGAEHVLQHQVGYDRVARVPIAAGVSGRAVRAGRALLIADVANDPAFLGAIDGLTSEICVPIDDAGQPAGFLNVESVGGVDLDETDLRLLEALGEQVGIAIGRARLHEALRASEARLAHLALHDPLTGLPNRRGLGAALGTTLARLGHGGPPVALLYLDLDGFKGVNDALGHEAGDYVLGEIADRLRACLRAGDTPARLGGDEFAILLAGAGPTEVRAIAARVVAMLALPVPIGTATATVSASAGVALAAAGETADDLLRRADAALYAAKHAGKNRFLVAADKDGLGNARTA